MGLVDGQFLSIHVENKVKGAYSSPSIENETIVIIY